MSELDVLIEISRIGRMIAGSLLYRRLASRAAMVIALTIVTGMLAGTLLVGGFYAAYLTLIRHGLDAEAALLTVGSVIALVTACCAAVTVHLVRRLRYALLPLPVIPQVRHVASAFMDGFQDAAADSGTPARERQQAL